MSLFSFKMERPMYTAQLMALYILVDGVCILQMSLATYCVIKLCLTGTFKVSYEAQTGKWIYSTKGVPHRLRRLLICATLLPIVIVHDICY